MQCHESYSVNTMGLGPQGLLVIEGHEHLVKHKSSMVHVPMNFMRLS